MAISSYSVNDVRYFQGLFIVNKTSYKATFNNDINVIPHVLIISKNFILATSIAIFCVATDCRHYKNQLYGT